MIDYVLVLNNDFNVTDTIDTFKSLIWTERYSEYGDFELLYPASIENLNKVKIGYFLSIEDSDEFMIIQSIEIITDIEDGNYIKLSGTTLTKILTWRIVWYQTSLDGNIQTEVLSLLNRSLIQPSIPERKLENPSLVFERNQDLQSVSITRQFTGDNLYAAIKSICDTYNIGFRIVPNKDTIAITKVITFKMYEGTDRSYDQTENPHIVFSSEYGNLINSDYIETEANYCNVALVAGEDEGSSRRTVVAGDSTASSWNRRELYVDARDIQSENGDEVIDTTTYNAMLTQRGNEKLAEYTKGNAFDGEISMEGEYVYGIDYKLGDIVQIENDFGITAKARITEYIRSVNSESISEYPTFDILE